MNKIISNKYIYVGIISAALLIVLSLLLFSLFDSKSLEGSWNHLPDPNTIGHVDKTNRSSEELYEIKKMASNKLSKKLIYNFNNGKVFFNETLHHSNYSISGDKITITPILKETRTKDQSSGYSPWDYFEESNWQVNFNNDSIMKWTNNEDNSLSLIFKKR